MKKDQKPTISCKTISDADYVDDLVHLTNTPVQAKSLLHSREQTARFIGLYIILDKEFKCLKLLYCTESFCVI